MNIFEVENLCIAIDGPHGKKTVVEDVGFSLKQGTIHGVVGESGTGKTMTANALSGLLSKPAQVTGGRIRFKDQLFGAAEKRVWKRLRGRSIFMMFQSAAQALNPSLKTGSQLAEVLQKKEGLTRKKAVSIMTELLGNVGLGPETIHKYPFQLSGGMRQRVQIAMAIALGPDILIADEPTTGLDPITQMEILNLLGKLKDDTGMSILFISHDLRAVSYLAQTVSVMHQGKVVETGAVDDILTPDFSNRANTLPARTGEMKKSASEPLLKLESVSMRYPGKNGTPPSVALDHVSFSIERGCATGVVGRSGAGKSTLARLILGLESPSRGNIVVDGVNTANNRRDLNRKIQIIWQDPSHYLNPYYTVARLISEPLEVFRMGDKAWRTSRTSELLDRVGLGAAFLHRKPHELSGGQCQRVAIARALAVNPDLLVCDEPFSGLDAPSRLRLINLLRELQEKSPITLLLISHDISVVRSLCRQIAVLEKGRIVELAEPEEIVNNPSHAFTKKMIESSRMPPLKARTDRGPLKKSIPNGNRNKPHRINAYFN